MTTGTLQVEAIGIEEQQKYGHGVFPLVLACQAPTTLDGATSWIAENRRQLCDRAALHGAILFRGFPLTGAEDFDRFITAFDLPNFPYDDSLSNAVRVIKTPRVFTANEAPPTRDDFSAPRDGADAHLSRQAVLLLRAAGGRLAARRRCAGRTSSGIACERNARGSPVTANRRD